MSENARPPDMATEGCRGPVALVVSPHARRGKTVSVRKALETAGVVVGEQIQVSDLDHRLPQGAAWRERGMVAVVAAGGDGTIGAVATQIADSGLPLGILPLGTSNDVARALAVPLELAGACEAIARGHTVEVDVGQALPAMSEPRALSVESDEHDEPEPSGGLRAALAARGAYFVHALTLGLNVSFARLATDVARRQRWGTLNYAASALEALAHFEAVPITLRLSGVRALGQYGVWQEASDDLVITCRAVQVAVVNLPVFGGAMNLHMPRVGMHDRLLDFVIIEALELPSLRQTIEGLVEALEKLGESLQSRRHPGNGVATADEPTAVQSTHHAETANELAIYALPGVRRYQARTAVIETPRHVDVTLDGEIRTHTPVLVRVAPEPLRVLAPELSFSGPDRQGHGT